MAWWQWAIPFASGLIIGAIVMRVYMAFRQARTRYIGRELERAVACARQESGG